ALFDEGELRRLPDLIPHFGELAGQKPPEERSYADIGEEVATPPDPGPAGAVVAVGGVVEGAFHEVAKRDRATTGDFVAERIGEGGSVRHRTGVVAKGMTKANMRKNLRIAHSGLS